jgi:hypothetical protein
MHYTLPSVVKPVLRRAHTIQESNKGAVTLKNAVLWLCWPQVSSEFLSCRNSSHCSYWLFAKSKKFSWRLELPTSKNIADVFSYHAIYVNIKALDSLSTRQPRTLELSWLTSRIVSLPHPWQLAEIRIIPYFQATSQIYSTLFQITVS